MYKLFAVNVHWLVRGFWKVAQQWVDEFTLSKINVLGGEFEQEILKVVPADQLEKKYGG